MVESDISQIEKCIRVGSKDDLLNLLEELDAKLFSEKKYFSQEYNEVEAINKAAILKKFLIIAPPIY